MALTDTAVRQAKPSGINYTIKDTDGLALFVGPKGAKQWHFRFYWLGRQARISLGVYPAVSLKDARRGRDEARALIAQGVDPRTHRREARLAASASTDGAFRSVFADWRAFKALSVKAGRQGTLEQIDRHFAKDILPWLGDLPITEISRQHVLEVLRRIERRKAMTTAQKCRTWLNQLFRYAMVEKGLATNPSADLDIVALPKPKVRHNPYLQMDELPELLRKLSSYGGHPNTVRGIRLLLLTGVRTGELRAAKPEQFDLQRKVWIISPELVKQLRVRELRGDEEIPPYIVPLSQPAIEIIKDLLQAKVPAQSFLLPHRFKIRESISENTLNMALKRMGYNRRLTGHGIRGTLSTALNELGYKDKWIDAQLSHADPNKVRRSYNHAKYVVQRQAMMQDWADRLECWERGLPQPALPKSAVPQGLDVIAAVLKTLAEQSPLPQELIASVIAAVAAEQYSSLHK